MLNCSLGTEGFKELWACFLVLWELTRKGSAAETMPCTSDAVLTGPRACWWGTPRSMMASVHFPFQTLVCAILTNSCSHLTKSVYKIQTAVYKTWAKFYPSISKNHFQWLQTHYWILALTVSQYSLRLQSNFKALELEGFSSPPTENQFQASSL